MSDGGGVSRRLRIVAASAATLLTGSFAIGFLTSAASDQFALYKKKKYGKPCLTCKGIGYSPCKLCKGKGTVQWSPLYNPIVINPCVCPTCDGFKVQHCLNCLGYGSV